MGSPCVSCKSLLCQGITRKWAHRQCFPLPLSDGGQTNVRQVLDLKKNTKAVDVDRGSRSRAGVRPTV